MRTLPLLIGLLLLPIHTGHAQIFKSVDAEGNVTFSDTPPVNDGETRVQEVDVGPMNTATVPPPVVRPTPAPTPEETPKPLSVTITHPADGATMSSPEGSFTVTVETGEPLDSNNRLQLQINGGDYDPPQRVGAWEVRNAPRGQHQLRVSIIDLSGRILASSEPAQVFVSRRPTTTVYQ